MRNTRDIGIYIHWPFCAAKCPYCDFNSHVHETIDQQAWKSSYIKALKYYADQIPDRRVVSVFFGGGTPSLMPPDTVEGILKTINDSWSVAEGAEVTLEANPTSVEIKKFKNFRAAGVNRVSLGIQSLNDSDLKFLGRKHSESEALRAIETARKVFDRHSFDLIYARPGQTLAAWGGELGNALQHAGGHLSLYQLTIERSTPFYFEHAKGNFKMPTETLAADFYNLTQEVMEQAGLPAYEVSNHARAGQESRHNLIYWRYGEYLGVGPGAHGRMAINGHNIAIRDHQMPQIWLDKVAAQGHGAHPYENLAARDKFLEALMMGLRIREGVSYAHLEEKSGIDVVDALDEKKLQALRAEKLFYDEENHLRLTREGWLRLNAVVPFILRENF